MTKFEIFRENALSARNEFTRRADLARQPKPVGVNGPRLKLLLGELGAVHRRRGRALVTKARHPQPVMLLPGFGSHPMRMRRMLTALGEAGHQPYDWGLGLNLGPTPENFAFLLARVSKLAARHGAPVALIGWSLGGLFARELARLLPDAVSMVITMGTPFSGDRRANNAWRAYQLVTGHTVDAPPIPCDFAIALWSPRDGVIAPRSACGWPGERDRAVAMRCSHLEFASHPAVIGVVLGLLDGE